MVSRLLIRSIAIPVAVAAVSVWAVGQDSPYWPPASAPAANAPAANAPAANTPQDAPQQAAAATISVEELNQLLAPVALYPDVLLSQVLMASTYPLEVVQARRWVDAHPMLRGDDLANELAKESWDPSVKSLVATPSVLQLMDDKLDWTIKLGDAFLAQQGDVMTTVQQLRAQAQAAGNLQNSEQLRVNTAPATPPVTAQYPAAAAPAPVAQYITIEDTSPEYVYVPVYDPGYVYGSWSYVNYQPFFWHPQTYVPTRGFWYDRPRPRGPAWSYAWGRIDWQQRQLDLDSARAGRYRRQLEQDAVVQRIRERDERFRDGRSEEWRHDNTHRLGVGYRDAATARRYTGRDDAVRAQTDQQRRDRPGTPQRPVIPNASGAIKGQIMPGANPPNNPGRLPPTVTDRPQDRTGTDRTDPSRTDTPRTDNAQTDLKSSNDRSGNQVRPAPAECGQGRSGYNSTPCRYTGPADANRTHSARSRAARSRAARSPAARHPRNARCDGPRPQRGSSAAARAAEPRNTRASRRRARSPLAATNATGCAEAGSAQAGASRNGTAHTDAHTDASSVASANTCG